MLEVQIENIIPVSEAHDRFDQIIASVSTSDDLYVLTQDGKPSAVIVGAKHLETLTGDKHTELMGAVAGAAASGIESSPTMGTGSSTTAPASGSVAGAAAQSFTYDNIVTEASEDTAAAQPAPAPAGTPVDTAVAPADSTPNMSDGINDTIAMSTEPAPSTIGAPSDPTASLSVDDQADEPDPSNSADISADATSAAPVDTSASVEPVLTTDPMAAATAAPSDAVVDPYAMPPASTQV